ncbi:DUF4198 domain-containing protein [Hyphococcus luteus]|uniref:DUF4198 domain-containing protein n=1 Tax=Hyphococcus luteus TaxID=2058213 RepID=A0A2S7K1U5_9PROT|nr:DUF4198 domain-containing protein [Marinicaulis flavus]PQA86466.1 DUF4198 domain-containing protein [Marinicaulis flavus]
MTLKKWTALALALLIPTSAMAHRTWFLPSSTVLSGDDVWVTVDAAAANEVFYFDHRPLRLEDLVIAAPDGSSVEPQNMAEGRLRNSFDLNLKQQGTYRVSLVSDGVFAFYKVNGEQKRWRGQASEIETAIPKDAEDVRISESARRVDTFVTVGAPTDETVKTSGKGLEIEYGVHPNDLFAGETASFRLLMNGKPAKGVVVSVIRDGIRYRNALNEMKVTTGDDGSFDVTWPEAGMYWLNATMESKETSVPRSSGSRAGYTATLEVLPQ